MGWVPGERLRLIGKMTTIHMDQSEALPRFMMWMQWGQSLAAMAKREGAKPQCGPVRSKAATQNPVLFTI